MRILITGGAGYLGCILSKKLLAKGYQVRVIDGLWYGNESIKELLKDKKFEIIEQDIRNLVATVKAMKNVDAVIHLASIVGMPASNIEPRTSEEVNYLATKNIAELCELHNIETYIFASTCSVYGSQPNTIITEKSPVSPLDYYAKQKFLSERAISWLNRAPTILRFGTLFGDSPRMRFDLVINLFIAQALLEKKITVFGGSQYRPFLHVSDAADSLIFALENNLTGTYNVISENMTILEAAQRIKKIIGCEIIISNDDEDLRNYKVSANKINQMGFKSKKNIEFAIDEIKMKIKNGEIKNYKENKYSNYKTLFSSKEMQEKVFIQGINK
jgi:nucleoside-diphosphate-sugar epimerase|tara:strand:- start:692 stop:1681 length:990 start_codon:yes stop_codon:yes gene_type:complete